MQNSISTVFVSGKLWFKGREVCELLNLDLNDSVLMLKMSQNRWGDYIQYIDEVSYFSEEGLGILKEAVQSTEAVDYSSPN